jgi:hypothetical protein
MPVETQSTARPGRRRLWPRFTLRVLLVVVTTVGIALGYWTHRARQQRRIVELIEAGGGSVFYKYGGPSALRLSPVIAWLAESLGRDYVENVVEAAVHDRETVPEVLKLRRWRQLQMYGDALDDRQLAQLAGCRDLEVLNLDFGLKKVSHPTLRMLSQLPKLRVLHLRGVGISEAGIRDLAASPTLEVLDIGSCDASVDASDFDAVKRYDRIKSLHVWRRGKNGSEEIIARW